MDFIEKVRRAAFMQASLRAFFGDDFDTFRWFDSTLKQGALAIGSCVVMTTISELTTYLHPLPNPLVEIRAQFDVLDVNPSTASAAAKAINAWLATGSANFADNTMFASPSVPGVGVSNFKLNQMGIPWPTTNRPVPRQMLEYRMLNVDI